MYNTDDSPKHVSKISAAQVMLAALIVVGSLVLPIYLIEQNKHSGPVPYTVQAIGSQAGRVAGAQDVSNLISSEAEMLTIVGMILFTLAVMLIIYLLVTGDKHKRR